jgi:hypothetical protein
MKRFQLSRKEIDAKKLQRRTAQESDTSLIYDEPGVYELDSKPVIIYGRLEERHKDILWAVKTLGMQTATRETSKDGSSRIFGFRPRITIGSGNFCSVTSAFETHPEQHKIICEFGKTLDRVYKKNAPKVYQKHQRLLAEFIKKDWRIPGTSFTSGIVNRNNPLLYHYDKGNLFDVMSCMVVFRHLCEGGFLSIPEFGARWLLNDRSYFLFDGQSCLHGVTPIQKLNQKAYRYSVVYYALRKMQECGTREEELCRVRTNRRLVEKRRSTKSEQT